MDGSSHIETILNIQTFGMRPKGSEVGLSSARTPKLQQIPIGDAWEGVHSTQDDQVTMLERDF